MSAASNSLYVDGAASPHETALPEQELACAVIIQAIEDVRSTSTNPIIQNELSRARSFLFARSGPWAHARTIWCDRAGINREWLERLLTGGNSVSHA